MKKHTFKNVYFVTIKVRINDNGYDKLIMEYQIIRLRKKDAENPHLGSLSFIEWERDIPFDIKRVYCIFNAEKESHRGFHAHKNLCQLLFCPYGEIDIILDDGESRERVRLHEPDMGLVLPPGLWREMVWKKDGSVLCVAASAYYDANDYIRSYEQFLAYVKSGKPRDGLAKGNER